MQLSVDIDTSLTQAEGRISRNKGHNKMGFHAAEVQNASKGRILFHLTREGKLACILPSRHKKRSRSLGSSVLKTAEIHLNILPNFGLGTNAALVDVQAVYAQVDIFRMEKFQQGTGTEGLAVLMEIKLGLIQGQFFNKIALLPRLDSDACLGLGEVQGEGLG